MNAAEGVTDLSAQEILCVIYHNNVVIIITCDLDEGRSDLGDLKNDKILIGFDRNFSQPKSDQLSFPVKSYQNHITFLFL